MTKSSEPVACTLTTKNAANQLTEWADLQGLATKTESLDNGAAMTFPVDLADKIDDLAKREAACCGFLSLTTTRSGDTVRLVVTTDNPDGYVVIDALAGTSRP